MEVFYTPSFISISKRACDYQECWEDCHQDAVVMIFEKGWDINTIDNLEAFFYVCVWQNYKNWCRGRINWSRRITTDIIEESDAWNEIVEEVAKELDYPRDIDDWYLKTLLKAYWEHGTYQAVADKTGIPLGTVYRDVNRITKKLKQKITG